MHFAQRSRLKKAIEIQLVGFGDPIVTLRPKVMLKITRFYGYRKRAFDLDNLYGSVKLLVDAMRGLEIIQEDTPKHIDLTVEQKKSPDKSTFVTIHAAESESPASI
jgi:Holliday junction resolvase RusA-like endonuclease